MLVILIIIVSAIWVLIDAKNIGVRKGLVTGIGDMGAVAWFFVTLGLWIIGFPMYLYYRGQYKLAVVNLAVRSGSVKTNLESDAIDNLGKLAVLRNNGIISDDEFEAKKKQFLGL